jgi:choline dehydrogenase-like flavoprotein
VILLESGGWHQHEETHPLNEVVQLGTNYRGATHGRFRCLGGTSTRWGGALIPFLPEDLEARPFLDLPAWPIGFAELCRHVPEIEAIFKVDAASYDEDFVDWFGAAQFVPTGDAHFLPRFAKWPSFPRRNLSNLFKRYLAADSDLQVWLNATAHRFNLENSRIVSLSARSLSGRRLTVSADAFIVCGGAIESTRLLLYHDRLHNQAIFGKESALGKYFHDHISTAAAQIRPVQIDRLNRMAGFRFAGATMHSLRFELSPAAARKEGVASAFGHISFRTKKATAFESVRKIMHAMQGRHRIHGRDLADIFWDLPNLARMAFWRSWYHQLYWPKPADYHVHVVVEQLPYRDNCITLAAKTDIFGVPLAAICWNVYPMERKTLGVYARLFSGFWAQHELDKIGALEWLFDLDAPIFSAQDASDIFHPGGSTRMGLDRQSAVVDRDLKTFSIDNLWILSTSVFPSGASANPTMMLTLLALRLADHLAKLVSDGRRPVSIMTVSRERAGV